ncbi:MAG: hypothetical protein ACRC37_00745, partial [Lentisphaeria bacterium]
LNSMPIDDLTASVIDFDATKRIICAEKELQMLSSCDALRIIPEKNRIDFIELKSIRNYILHSKNLSSDEIAKKIRSFDLPGKIRDSFFLLSTIVYHKNLALTKNERHFFSNQIKLNYFICIDTDLYEDAAIYNLALTMEYLSLSSLQFHKKIQEMLHSVIIESPIKEIDDPKIVGIKALNNFYYSLDHNFASI